MPWMLEAFILLKTLCKKQRSSCIHGANSVLFDQIDVTSCLVYVSVYSAIFSSYLLILSILGVYINFLPIVRKPGRIHLCLSYCAYTVHDANVYVRFMYASELFIVFCLFVYCGTARSWISQLYGGGGHSCSRPDSKIRQLPGACVFGNYDDYEC